MIQKSDLIPIFKSKCYSFLIDESQPGSSTESCQLYCVTREFFKMNFEEILNFKKPSAAFLDSVKLNNKDLHQKTEILFCGGPISALKICPRKTFKGI